MWHPFLSTGKNSGFSLLLFAANDPIGPVPDLPSILRDQERNRSGYQRQRSPKHPAFPPPLPAEQKDPDIPPHVDDYA
ncbi:MAG: hypothetical protein LLG15_01200 [Betaproteobacteria bacterium]|nr:hypothetical protein [Betaproteobacteria bacterium]